MLTRLYERLLTKYEELLVMTYARFYEYYYPNRQRFVREVASDLDASIEKKDYEKAKGFIRELLDIARANPSEKHHLVMSELRDRLQLLINSEHLNDTDFANFFLEIPGLKANKKELLFQAIHLNRAEPFKIFFESKDLKLNSSELNKALDLAIYKKNTEIVNLLLQNENVNPNLPDMIGLINDDSTKEINEILARLLKRSDIDVNVTDREGTAFLILALNRYDKQYTPANYNNIKLILKLIKDKMPIPLMKQNEILKIETPSTNENNEITCTVKNDNMTVNFMGANDKPILTRRGSQTLFERNENSPIKREKSDEPKRDQTFNFLG